MLKGWFLQQTVGPEIHPACPPESSLWASVPRWWMRLLLSPMNLFGGSDSKKAKCITQAHTERGHRPGQLLRWPSTASTCDMIRTHIKHRHTDNQVPILLRSWSVLKVTSAGTRTALQAPKHMCICRSPKYQHITSVCLVPPPCCQVLLITPWFYYSPVCPTWSLLVNDTYTLPGTPLLGKMPRLW